MSKAKQALQTLNKNVWQLIVAHEMERYKHVTKKLYTQPFKVSSKQLASADEAEVLNDNKMQQNSLCIK